MKLVLLPGMDGTGKLFSPLVKALSAFDCEVIELPNTGPQDYASITQHVASKLPKEDFILIAESFSGPIGLALAKQGVSNLKGVIFVATFLSAPNKLLLSFTRLLPVKQLSGLPLSKFFHRALFLAGSASDELLKSFQVVIDSLPAELIRTRLGTMQSLVHKPESIELPAAYIQATSDRLVPAGKAQEFNESFNNLTIKTVDGPHFVLQAKPEACALLISELVLQLTSADGVLH